MSNTLNHAKRELRLLGYLPLEEAQEDGPDKWVQENILELLTVFANRGHSGSSAPYVVKCFEKLALFKPLSPIMGTDDEWNDVSKYSNEPC